MANVGEVSFNIYFGTKYDNINVPYQTADIRTFATKTLSKVGQYVWQSTYISLIEVGVIDYQDIVGAQYVEITDVGTESHGNHWFTVAGYQQINRKTAALALIYDPLLTIGISWMTKVSGFLQRWTVNNDTSFNYVNTPEPVSRADDFEFSYYKYDAVEATPPDDENSFLNLAGIPYDMTVQPEVVEYINADGTTTNILYPSLSTVKKEDCTKFYSSLDNIESPFSDGCIYYYWPDSSTPYGINYSRAIGLGHDVPVRGYMLPYMADDLYDWVLSGIGVTQSLKGNRVVKSTGLSLRDGGYNNSKTSDLGTMFTLYNAITGDTVNVDNYNLSNTDLQIDCNPYANGKLYARFSGYYNDVNGASGVVTSVSYPELTISSAIGKGVMSDKIGAYMAGNALVAAGQNTILASEVGMANASSQLGMSTVSNTAAGINAVISLSPEGGVNYAAGTINSAISYDIAVRNVEAALTKDYNTRASQWNTLNAQGDIVGSRPPDVKLAGVNASSETAGYTFSVRRSTFSARDRSRIDRFFTAYGYNVDDTALTDSAQLACRQRFTFAMVKDFRFTEVYNATTDLTRINDFMTQQIISERFASGLRIWNRGVEPDLDYTIPNPIV